MRGVYRVLAGLVALEVLIQAAAIAYAVFGLSNWIDEGKGHTLDKSAMDSSSGLGFSGEGGFALHGINGTMIVPLIALIFLIVSFFAKVERGVMLAGLTLLFVVIQVLLGMFAHSVSALGILHGPNALIIFGLAVTAMLKARHIDASTTTAAPDATASRV